MLAVVTAFMAGMAIGNFLFMRVRTITSKWYGSLEIALGLWTCATILLIPLADRVINPLLGANPSPAFHWSVVFSAVLFLLLPATTALGATLPAAERFLTRASGKQTTALLYAANTAGAMTGAISAAFWFMPFLGIAGCLLVFGGVSITCGIAALFLARTRENPLPNEIIRTETPLHLSIQLFVSGLLGIGFEVVLIRALSQVLENTVYTFAAVLAVFLAGTALGAAIFHRAQKKGRQLHPASLFAGLALVTGIVGMTLRWTPQLYTSLRNSLGDSLLTVALAEALTAAVFMLAPTILMGSIWTSLAQKSLNAKPSLAWAVGVNTTGAAIAPLLFGAIILPFAGLKGALAIIPLIYALLTRGRKLLLPAIALALAMIPLQTSVTNLIDTGGGKLLSLREGIMGSVAVIENSPGARVLKFNNRFQMGGTAARAAEERQAHIPLLLHPAPQRALFIGLGTGITFAAAQDYPNLHADGIELVPEIAQAMRFFNRGQSFDNSRTFIADGRRFVRATDAKYDVIVADLFHPAQDGAGFLYTAEHFAAIRDRLAPAGLFCQWLPVYQMDLPTIHTIIATFTTVFPKSEIWLLRFNVDVPVVGLIARTSSEPLSPFTIENRTAENPILSDALKRARLNDTLRLLGCYVGPLPTTNVEINSDINPILLFRAPLLTFRKKDDPGARLLELLSSYKIDPANLAAADPAFKKRLQNFVQARDIYLQGLHDETNGELSRAIDAYIRSAQISEDFTAGYAQALAIATGLSKDRPEQTATILRRLIEARPELPVARELLRRFEPSLK